MSAPGIIEVERVGKVYRSPWSRGSVEALRSVSLEVRAGETLGLVGPNRAGKTTLLKLVLSLCRPTKGSVRRFGRPAADKRTLARVGYVHEHQALPDYLTAAQLLQYYGALTFVSRPALRLRTGSLLEQVGLADRTHEPIKRFSKGMRQRLCLAQALVNQPELLVLDEPTEGLDQPGKQLFADLVREHRRAGGSAILVTHVAADVERLCDRIVVLVEGTVVAAGSVDEVTAASTASPSAPFDDVLLELYRKAAG